MTPIRLASADDAPAVLSLVARFHEEYGIAADDAHREAALMPLLEGSPHGAVWLFGPARAPLGYMIVSFTWSIELGGMDAFLDEIYVRPSVRGRGIATQALHALSVSLRDGGVKAIHLEVDRENEATHRLYARDGYKLRDRYCLMSRWL
ncbi:GNAT family N-acetyltransferase [Pelagovum pacificum]|uniref:GNAT family N-acetyltransferase n=1 Tax=Pelagovum pacificum TaxID=2588711 RepID=A0A5C5GD94_9RHOB|nr:GNAT family N-acetyltransferase [Pelagovum pacificum]QQA44404.1 GNAT family N-acetyltransferase [Pelagovum pacificum]TNY32480.1 GNAT family N-acetyltransferase [Pelagovum pacificum]